MLPKYFRGFGLFFLLLGILAVKGFLDGPLPVRGDEPQSEERSPETEVAPEDPSERLKSVYVLPVQGQIGKPALYILRRGMKEAIADGVDVVVLDMDTPGGRLDVTLEIMDMFNRFEGLSMTYVNTDAISAGAFIAASTKEIYFSPGGIMGAAAPVMGGGQEIGETMQMKLMSFLRARIRAFTHDVPYRADVLSAMVDESYVLEIEGEVLKPAGELLTLTASEAVETYGDPPMPLLADGIYPDLETMFNDLFGVGNYDLKVYEVTWSESVAQYIDVLAPLLIGLGLVLLYLEIQSPGFGVFGAAGIVLVATFFLGHYIAGLAGMEPILFFLLGVLLIATEVFLFPGTFVFAAFGIIFVIGSLVWGMIDIWPEEGIAFSPEILVEPLVTVFAGLIIAFVLAIAVARFLPRSWFWDRIILSASIGGNSQGLGPMVPAGGSGGGTVTISRKPAIGDRGVATSGLFPSGEVEINGKRYQARIETGSASSGDEVEVSGYGDFVVVVRKR